MTIIVCDCFDCLYNKVDTSPENKLGHRCGATAVGIVKKYEFVGVCDSYMPMPYQAPEIGRGTE